MGLKNRDAHWREPDPPNYWLSTNGTGVTISSYARFCSFRLPYKPLDFITEYNDNPDEWRAEKQSNKIITRSPSKHDALLDGRLELALEVFQTLLLKGGKLAQTKHFLHSILA
jgi:hypothetical protein